MDKVWRYQQEGETDKAWAAFQQYRDMPPIGENSRSYQNLADKLGYASTTTIERWASANEWQVRVKAYDDYISEKAVVLRESKMEEYHDRVIRMETELVAVAGQLILDSLINLRDEQLKGEKVDPMDIKRLTSSMGDVSNMARRAGNLPTTYRQEMIEEHDLEDQTFVVGGDD